MATVKKTEHGTWRVRWRDPNGRTQAKTFKKKAEADQYRTTVEHDKLTGAYVSPSAGKVTFRDFAEAWRARQVHRPSTAGNVETHLRRHTYPRLGDRPIAAIRPSEIQALITDRAHVLAPGTVAVTYSVLGSVFKSAVADRVIASSPCVGIRLPKRERTQIEPLTTEAVESITAQMPDRYQALVLTMAGTGLRPGEAYGLSVDRVDFLRRFVTVDRQMVLLPGTTVPVFGPPKTEASYRSVPLPDVVLEALSTHIATFELGQDGLVFSDDEGGPLNRRTFAREWRKAATAFGIEGGRLHDLRHYYASLLIRHGESVKVVQARLGHASAAETLDTYSHLWPDSEDRTRAAVDSVLGAGVSDLRQIREG